MASKRLAVTSGNIPKLDDFLCFAIYSANLAVNRVYKPLLDQLGLTYPQYLVLVVLYEEDDQTVGRLGDKLFLDSSTLTPLLKRMESAGLITRTRSARDERQVIVSLTEAGNVMRQEAQGIMSSILCALDCTREEAQQLTDRLVALRGNLEKNLP